MRELGVKVRRAQVKSRLAKALWGKWGIGMGLLLLLMVWGTLTWALSGVKVIVINDTDVPVQEMRIIFNGGARYVPLVAPGRGVSVRINPVAESHLEAEFTQLPNSSRHEVIDVYLEHDYRGTVLLRVKKAGRIQYSKCIDLPWTIWHSCSEPALRWSSPK